MIVQLLEGIWFVYNWWKIWRHIPAISKNNTKGTLKVRIGQLVHLPTYSSINRKKNIAWNYLVLIERVVYTISTFARLDFFSPRIRVIVREVEVLLLLHLLSSKRDLLNVTNIVKKNINVIDNLLIACPSNFVAILLQF